MNEPIVVIENGKRIKIPLRMQIEHNLAGAALRGDLKAGRTLEKYREFGWSFGAVQIPIVIARRF